jgi:transposase-like protein
MPITPTHPFKGRHFPGEVILLCVRWYLRYPLAYEHVAELLAERGVEVDPSCIWRWVQAYAPAFLLSEAVLWAWPRRNLRVTWPATAEPMNARRYRLAWRAYGLAPSFQGR